MNFIFSHFASLRTRYSLSHWHVLFFTLLLISPFIAHMAFAKPAAKNKKAQDINITSSPISFDRSNSGRKKFGQLEWRGGLSLSASEKFFGGYSGLALNLSGDALIAVSDAGSWLTAHLVYENNRLKAVKNARAGQLLTPKGKALKRGSRVDAEGITLLNPRKINGSALISFERRHRVDVYKFSSEKAQKSGAISTPKYARRHMKRNKGFEAITRIHSGPLKGATLLFSERLPDRHGNLIGWLRTKKGYKTLKLKRLDKFDVTDLASLPGGDVVILERRYRKPFDIRMRIRHIKARDLARGKLLIGDILLEAKLDKNIDNMEGIAAHRNKAGETILTLISDDNFNFLQRTLLMQFALIDKKLPRQK